MEASLLSILPNLSIGVIAVLAFAYTTIRNAESTERKIAQFIATIEDVQERYQKTLTDMRNQHEQAMKEREIAFRGLEREVRDKILVQLTENTKIMERVINQLDKR